MAYFIYESVCMKNVALFSIKFSYMSEYMYNKCHVWPIAGGRVVAHSIYTVRKYTTE